MFVFLFPFFFMTGRILYAKVAALIPKHREQVKAKVVQKPKASGNRGKVTGKGAPAPTKKKKKGKR